MHGGGNDDNDLDPEDGGRGHDEEGYDGGDDDDNAGGDGIQARRQNLKDLISRLQKKEVRPFSKLMVTHCAIALN